MKRKNLFTVNIDADRAIDHGALILREESAERGVQRKELEERLQKTLKKASEAVSFLILWHGSR